MNITLNPEALYAFELVCGTLSWIITLRTVHGVLQMRGRRRREDRFQEITHEALRTCGSKPLHITPDELTVNPK